MSSLIGGSVIYACSSAADPMNSTCLPDGTFNNPPNCDTGSSSGNKAVFMMSGILPVEKKNVLHEFRSLSHWGLCYQCSIIENGNFISDFWLEGITS